MKERPILFSGPMVKAILEGRKTQTRRVVKLAPPVADWASRYVHIGDFWKAVVQDPDSIHHLGKWSGGIRCPYGQPGDRLWVRETHITGWDAPDGDIQQFDAEGNELPRRVWYRADLNEHMQWVADDGSFTDNIPWKPSIHMPRWASRITLEITNVRVERLKDISEEDAESEGMEKQFRLSVKVGDMGENEKIPNSFRGGFANKWNEINGKKYPWASNPWVWVVEFKS